MSAAFDISAGQGFGQFARAGRPAVRIPVEPPRLSAPGAGEVADFLFEVAKRLTGTDENQLRSIPEDAPIWLGDVYSLVARQRPDDAVDILFDHIDDLLLAGRFAHCDELLRAVDLARLDTNLIVAVLSITLMAAEHLPYRARFFERARRRLAILAPDRVERLLSGLD